jgi:hypothetical protein
MRDVNCINEHALHPTFMRTCRCRVSGGARLPSGVLPGPSERAVTEYNVLQALSFVVTHCKRRGALHFGRPIFRSGRGD